MKHFACTECGNLVACVNYSGRAMSCCKREMKELTPKAEASRERHTPQISLSGNRVSVRVGGKDTPHPQTSEHRVDWVCLVTDKGSQRRVLDGEREAVAHFLLTDGEKPISAFAYCNLHGLWVAEAEPTK